MMDEVLELVKPCIGSRTFEDMHATTIRRWKQTEHLSKISLLLKERVRKFWSKGNAGPAFEWYWGELDIQKEIIQRYELSLWVIISSAL